jgi:hypothetical protein
MRGLQCHRFGPCRGRFGASTADLVPAAVHLVPPAPIIADRRGTPRAPRSGWPPSSRVCRTPRHGRPTELLHRPGPVARLARQPPWTAANLALAPHWPAAELPRRRAISRSPSLHRLPGRLQRSRRLLARHEARPRASLAGRRAPAPPRPGRRENGRARGMGPREAEELIAREKGSSKKPSEGTPIASRIARG